MKDEGKHNGGNKSVTPGLNTASLKAFGPAKVLAIMEGDRVDIVTKYYYNGSQSGIPPEPGGGTKRPIDWAEDGGSSEESSSGGNPPPPSSSTFQPINEILTQLSTIFTSFVSTISGGEFNQAGTSSAFGANSNLCIFLVSAFNGRKNLFQDSPMHFTTWKVPRKVSKVII